MPTPTKVMIVGAATEAAPSGLSAVGRRLAVLVAPHDPAPLPKRVALLIHMQEIESEQVIGWVQLALAVTFAALFFIAPRPADAGMAALVPVPIALAVYATFTLFRLRLAYRDRLPGWLIALSIIADTALLLGLIWSFHLHYAQPPAFSLKVPTFIYVLVFVALRALRFDPRYVLTAGLAAAGGWAALVVLAVTGSAEGTVTRNFVAYLNGNAILIGAEFDKIFAVLMLTAVLALAVARARWTLVTAVREQAAGREIRRFLSRGVADTIVTSETLVEAGQAVERDAAVMMLDIRGFTRFAAAVAPKDVVAMLVGCHERIVPLIWAHGGVIDKFLGDGVMATFGAVAASPTAAADALRALDAVMDAVEDWSAGLARDDSGPRFQINAAVTAGRVVFATIGSGERLEATVIGDAANLAAKLEKHNKTERTRAIAAGATYDLALAQGYMPPRPRERRQAVVVTGVAEPIDLVVVR